VSKGSHTTFSSERWEPRDCEHCGEPVTLSGKSNEAHGGAFFSYGDSDLEGRAARSWHADCKFKSVRRPH
jgi:hypothetical protein